MLWVIGMAAGVLIIVVLGVLRLLDVAMSERYRVEP